MMKLLLLALAALPLAADGPGVILSSYVREDFPLSTDPAAPEWQAATPIYAANGPKGDPTPGHRTEIRSRWSEKNLYFLFICPYEALNLKPNPTTTEETNKLWDWDVAEVFIGTNFQNIRRYTEFEVSPQGEWVDLDIDRDHPLPQGGWLWNSGFKTAARVDSDKKVWYGAMRIPIDKVDTRPPQPGREMRVNFYRIQGPGPSRNFVAWQPTHTSSYHVPEAFGLLKLVQ
jgi:hypothetical protein